MLADLPSGHVFRSHALYVKITLDVINYFAKKGKETETEREGEKKKKERGIGRCKRKCTSNPLWDEGLDCGNCLIQQRFMKIFDKVLCEFP